MGSASSDRRLVRALRARHQRLTPGQRADSPGSAVRWMTAMQAQDRAAAAMAVSLRTVGRPTEVDVLSELAAGTIVRNRPSRGTLQITAPEDLGWMTALMAPRSNAAARKRRDGVGVTEEMVRAVADVARSELAGGRTRTRSELVAACAAAGTELDGGQAGHVLRHLTEEMVIVFAEPHGRDDTFALAEEWIDDPRRLEGDEALGELAARYVAARGPVTERCLGWWSNLAVRDVRRAIEAAGERIERVELDGTKSLVQPGGADLAPGDVDAALAEPLLLPAFDEYLLGYRDRAPVIAPEHETLVVPGRNGMFRPIVVVDGVVVATWARTARRAAVTVTVEPFEAIDLDGVRDGLRRRVAELAAFAGRGDDHEVTVEGTGGGPIVLVAQST